MVTWDWTAAIDGARQDKAARASLAATRLTRPEPAFSRELTAAGKRFHARIGRLFDRTASGARCRDYYARQEQQTRMNASVTQLPAVAQQEAAAIMERVIIHGDLSKLTPEERTRYYMQTCTSLGLNPLTRPLEYVRLSGKEVLYAKRDAADQLRKRNGISLEIVRKGIDGELLTVEVRAVDATGRVDYDMGVVSIAGLRGEALANAYLKAVTKAKRRVTLSISGLGFLDETEVDSVQPVERVEPPAAKAVAAAEPPPADPPKPKRPFRLEGVDRDFPSSVPGFEAALDEIEADVPRLVLLNQNILDRLLGISGQRGVPDYTSRINDLRARARQALTPAHAEPPPTLDLVLADGEIKSFPKTKRSEGIPALLDLLERELAHPAPMVMLEPDNIALLDTIAKLPEFAPRVADIRARARQALTPAHAEPDMSDLTDEALGIDYDPETGERIEPEPDRIAQRVAVRRGSAPSDDGPAPGDVSALE